MTMQNSQKGTTGRTISRDLIKVLISCLVAIVLVVSLLYYAWAMSVANKDLESYADHSIDEFCKNIALPMFNFETQIVRRIAEATLQAESIAGITVIMDSTIVFQQLPEKMVNVFDRKQTVVWEGATVGDVRILFTREKIRKERMAWMTLTVLILSCVILAIGLTTHFILKSFLNRPLQNLIRGIRQIADGDYQSRLDPVVHSDINMIIREINKMAGQITRRTNQVEESGKQYRSIFENAVEGIYKTAINGRFLKANPALADILGYDSPLDLIRSITDIGSQLYVNPEQQQEFLKEIKTKKIVTGYLLELYRKDKTRIWVESNGRAIYDDSGELAGIEGFIVDISQRKQMEIELRQAFDALDNRVRERTQELEEKTARLERVNKLFVDRELRMKELKARIRNLEAAEAQKKGGKKEL